MSVARKAKDNAITIDAATWTFADAMLAEFWSMDQIGGYLDANIRRESFTIQFGNRVPND